MRIVSYNILDGGEGRADPLAEVIEAQRADVVALVEADLPEVVERIARRLDLDVVEGVGKRSRAAILSRWPIVESVDHGRLQEALSDCFLEATVMGPAGEPWTFGVVHLQSHASEEDERRREREVDVILRVFEGRRQGGKPHLLAGDFNANAPAQQIDPAKCKPRTRKEWDANGGGVPRRAVRKLLDAGYVDTLHAVGGDEAARTGSFSTRFPGQRVDYIFSFGVDRSRLKSAWVEQDRLAKYASDHFPVGAEIV